VFHSVRSDGKRRVQARGNFFQPTMWTRNLSEVRPPDKMRSLRLTRMANRIHALIRSGIFALAFGAAILAQESRVESPPTAARVLVVYAANGGDSKQLADYYVRKRGIPAANVLGVNISVLQTGYYYTDEYPKFYSELAGPIKAKLNKLGPANIDVILLVG